MGEPGNGRAKQLSIIIGLFVIALSSLLALDRLPASGAVKLLTDIAFAILVGAVLRSLESIFDLMKQRDPSVSFRDLGMLSVSRRLGDEALRSRLVGAQSIKVLKTWFPETELIQEGLNQAIKGQRARVELLLANPGSKILEVRSEGAGESADHGKYHVVKALTSLATSARHAGDQQVQVGLYDSWPACPIIWYDDKILLGFYFRKHPSPEWPWIEVDPKSELGRILDGQYESLWLHEATIHLKSVEEIEEWVRKHSEPGNRG